MVSSPCCFPLAPLHHWSPPLALQRQASESSAPRPRRNLLPLAVWMDPLSSAPPAEREWSGNVFFRFWIMTLLYQTYGMVAYFYRVSFRFLFIFLILLFSEVHLHSAVIVIGLCFLCFLLLLRWHLGLGLFLANKTQSPCSHS